MEQYSGNRRQHLFDFDWYFTRELPRLKDRYTGAHYTYKTTKAGQRCPYALTDGMYRAGANWICHTTGWWRFPLTKLRCRPKGMSGEARPGIENSSCWRKAAGISRFC